METHGGMFVWVLDTLGETSDIAPLLLLPELIRELSKALGQCQALLGQALEPGLQTTTSSGQHFPLLILFYG